ncbi:MAG: hypothetical protein R2813_05250 [Flavobacteriales bacterium]
MKTDRMQSSFENYFDFVEWEWNHEMTFHGITFVNDSYSENSSYQITFQRGDDFNIEATLSGLVSNHKDLQLKHELIDGVFLRDEEINAKTNIPGYNCRMTGVAFGHEETIAIRPLLPVKINLMVDEIDIFHDSHLKQLHILREWMICAENDFFFPRPSQTKNTHVYEHKWNGDLGSIKISSNGGIAGGKDHLQIEFEEYRVIAFRIHNDSKKKPFWASKIGLEYRMDSGGIPPKSVRDSIRELLGFFMGTKLTLIGNSRYDRKFNIIGAEYHNLFGVDAKKLCNENQWMPIPLRSPRNALQFESIFKKLLKEYIILRKELSLNLALSYYWHSYTVHFEMSTPTIFNALEVIANNFLDEDNFQNQHIVDPSEFQMLIGSELQSIRTRLIQAKVKTKDVDRIVSRIANSSLESGVRSKLQLLFKELIIEIGAVEKKALTERNKLMHGSFDPTNDKKVRESVRLRRASQTLFNKVLLKILGYESYYIDYYSTRAQPKLMSVPIGE